MDAQLVWVRQTLPPAVTCHLLHCSTCSSVIVTVWAPPSSLGGCKDKLELPTWQIMTQNREKEDWVLPGTGHTLAKHPLERLSCTPETTRLQLIPGLQLHTLVARRKQIWAVTPPYAQHVFFPRKRGGFGKGKCNRQVAANVTGKTIMKTMLATDLWLQRKSRSTNNGAVEGPQVSECKE